MNLKELKKYLEDECYNLRGIYIENNLHIRPGYGPEGFVIGEENGVFKFCYSERGSTDVIASFDTEEELAEYALSMLNKDKWNKGHLVAWSKTEEGIIETENYLKSRNINFERNDVPCYYGKGKHAYRIFVFGKDILKIEDLDGFKEKYMKDYYKKSVY